MTPEQEQKLDQEDQARRARLTAPGALRAAAIWYATQGHLVFPLAPGTKVPVKGTRGFKDATMNPETVARWWDREPRLNIGLTTGHLFDVIDVDGPTGYWELGILRDAGLLPEIIGRVATPRGAHLYIRPTGDGNTTAIRPGIDYRGQGGYVVAPPSLIDGTYYQWTTPLHHP